MALPPPAVPTDADAAPLPEDLVRLRFPGLMNDAGFETFEGIEDVSRLCKFGFRVSVASKVKLSSRQVVAENLHDQKCREDVSVFRFTSQWY